MIDLLIRGGQVITPEASFHADVGISGETIAFVAQPGAVDVQAGRIVDAAGLLVLPGAIDPHVHFALPLSDTLRSQSFAAGSRAAAHGGTTTVVDFVWQDADQGLGDAIDRKFAQLASDRANIDFALHAMMTGSIPNRVIDELEDAVSAGITSFKVFTTFSPGSAFGAWQMDDGRIWGLMQAAARHGGVVMAHCEDDCIINFCSRGLAEQGVTDGREIHRARPNLAEEAAIRRMLLLAERTGCPLYVVHISTHEGVDALHDARARGVRAYGEVLHNYLVFTKDAYQRPNGLIYNNYPPLKSQEDREALWRGLQECVLDTVASDDCAIPLAAKLRGQHIGDVAGGHNGVETRLLVLFSGGVTSRRITVNRFVEVTSASPAKLFGIHPRKGIVAPGSDADIVLWDAAAKRTIRQADLHSDCDYSIWEGFECTGVPVMTISGGTVLVENDRWVGPEGKGRFVKAKAVA